MTALDPAVEPTFEDLAIAVDRAVEALAGLDPEARRVALELKDAVEAFHRPALVHLVRTFRADERGAQLLGDAVDEPAVRAVFALQGIIRTDPTVRAERALAAVRPYLRSHGGDVELVAIEAGTAKVRLHGSCSGCSMSAVTLRDGVSEALVSGVEEIERVEVVDDAPTTAVIELGATRNGSGPIGAGTGTGPGEGWARGPALVDVGDPALVRFDHDGASFVVTSVGRRIAAFRNACVHQGMSLDGGELADGVLTCPWHGFRFDASTGECLTAPTAQLEQVPSRIDGDNVWIRIDGR